MATVSDVNTTTLSGLAHIDALLDEGPDWNYLTPYGNTIYYSFSVTEGNESGTSGQAAFTLEQQAATRTAFDYISRITGIVFTETVIGTAAQIQLCNIDIEGSNTVGLCSWSSSYTHIGDTLESYEAKAYVYMDNVEWRVENSNLAPGTTGYETLLHELGHAIGLKHPFEGGHTLPSGHDHTGNTVMSYTDSGGPHSTFSPYDIAALNWLYGGDGLRGALGMNSTTGARYLTGTVGNDSITGTAFNDALEGSGGNDILAGGAGEDTAVFRGARSSYTFSELSTGELVVTSALEGTDTLSSVEVLRFTDGSFQRSQLTGDLTAPAAPTLAVSKNAAGYTAGNKPLVSGAAEAGSTVRVYHGENMVGEVKVDATGLWSLNASAFQDGLGYTVFATATDGSGNVSARSENATFNVDATAPVKPTANLVLGQQNNEFRFSGTGEAGTTIQLVRITDATEIARATVKADGTWSTEVRPFANGQYEVGVASVDIADNATSGDNRLSFNVNSALNTTGSAAAEVFTASAGNNALDGQGGLDTMTYTGARAAFTVAKEVLGHSVTDKSGALGLDTLVNIERLKFDDATLALDVNGVAGQAYRMYRAAFDREPDLGGLGFWIKALDSGSYTLNDIAAEFIKSPEFVSMYMSDPSDENFVTKLYAHVLHRPAEGAGFDFWVNGLKTVSRAEVLAFFTESPENQAQVIGTIQNGIEYTPWG